MKLRRIVALLAVLGAAPALSAQTPTSPPELQALFEEASAAFNDARAHAESHPADHDGIAKLYRTAGDRYAKVWKYGGASSEVFTNAANSYAFAGDAGQAILFYKRALAVDPSNGVARQGLETLRAGLPIRRKAGGAAASIARSLFFWHESLGFGVRRTAFAALWLGAFALFAVSMRRRPFFRLAAWCALVPGIAFLGSLVADAVAGSVRDDAVILIEVEGREGDGRVYSPSHSKPFPPGTETTILALREGTGAGAEPWVHIRLLDGTDSFVPEGVLEKVIR